MTQQAFGPAARTTVNLNLMTLRAITETRRQAAAAQARAEALKQQKPPDLTANEQKVARLARGYRAGTVPLGQVIATARELKVSLTWPYPVQAQSN